MTAINKLARSVAIVLAQTAVAEKMSATAGRIAAAGLLAIIAFALTTASVGCHVTVLWILVATFVGRVWAAVIAACALLVFACCCLRSLAA